jgi:hypothetical protein
MSVIRVIDNFYVQHQKILSVPEKPQVIPPSIIDTTDPKFQDIILHMYTVQLKEIIYLLNDSRIYVEHHYTGNSGYNGEINYHNWFFYENLISQLKLANSTLLNPKYHDRYISHPINILQYYQPDHQNAHGNVEIPAILQTHQQQFGSLYEDPYQTNMGKDTKNKTVTL